MGAKEQCPQWDSCRVKKIEGELGEMKELLVGDGKPEEGVLFRLRMLATRVNDIRTEIRAAKRAGWTLLVGIVLLLGERLVDLIRAT